MPAYYANNCVVLIASKSEDKTKCKITYADGTSWSGGSKYNWLFRVQTVKFAWSQITFDFSNLDPDRVDGFSFLRANNSYIYFTNCDIIGIPPINNDVSNRNNFKHAVAFWLDNDTFFNLYNVQISNFENIFMTFTPSNTIRLRGTIKNAYQVLFWNSSGGIIDDSTVNYENVFDQEHRFPTISHKFYNDLAGFVYYRGGSTHPFYSGGWSGPSSERPQLEESVGQPYFDTDLNLPIWFNGTDWVDSQGNVV
jgi:hypothetical protein